MAPIETLSVLQLCSSEKIHFYGGKLQDGHIAKENIFNASKMFINSFMTVVLLGACV